MLLKNDTWLISKCRIVCTNILILWILLFLACIFFMGKNFRYINNFINGPYILTYNDIDNIKSIESTPEYFVTLKAESILPTGVQEVTVHKRNGVEIDRNVSAQCLALATNSGRIMIVKSSKTEANTFTGEIVPIPIDLYNKLQDVFNNNDDAELNFYPFYLDCESSFRMGGYICIGIMIIIIIFFIFNGIPAYRCLKNINEHPLIMRVASWGDPTNISRKVQKEYEADVKRIGIGIKLSEHYIFKDSFFYFNLIRIEDIVWAYKKVTTKYLSFIIPLFSYYEAIFIGIEDQISFIGSENDVDSALQFVANRNVWAIYVYTNEIARMYKNNPHAFINLILNEKNNID